MPLLRNLLGGALEEFVDQSLIGLGLLGGESGRPPKADPTKAERRLGWKTALSTERGPMGRDSTKEAAS
jgi:hypothetical protein